VIILYKWLNWGFTGICWATAIHFLTRFLSNFTFITFDPHWKKFEKVPFLSEETVSNLGQQIKIGAKQASMSVWGWWAFDIFTLMASYMSPEAIAAQTCMRSIGLFAFMIPAGISGAASTLCGNSVGKENVEMVNLYYKMALFCSAAISCFLILVLWMFEESFIKIFTD